MQKLFPKESREKGKNKDLFKIFMIVLELGSKTRNMEKTHIFILIDKNIMNNNQK
jgi:hypothetical protein